MSWHVVSENNTRQEIVKCVVVGDTAVGKTRLICARACNAYLTLPQMLTTHIPTIWAIDQYRIQKEVLRRSWMVVDGVHVSLRLWDTFGDHEKDRKFAYGRSDVVLLCFSIANQQSLRNCKTKWYPEIRQYCPQAPIILVGCKNDLRHIYRDESFLELCREKSPYIKIVQDSELTTREQGREVAEEIGAVYYEASSLTQYGIEEVFVNAMRQALIARRQQRFWAKNLKNVQSPLLQMPYCPPEPREPAVTFPDSTFDNDILSLLVKEYEPDVTVLAGNEQFPAHRLILASASFYFHHLFISLLTENQDKGRKCTSNQDTSILKTIEVRNFQEFSPNAVFHFLRFLYSGLVDANNVDDVEELEEVSEIAEIEELQMLVKSPEMEDDCFKHEIKNHYMLKLLINMKTMALQKKLYTDVVFEVDDGKCYAHRSILMTRCAVMEAMFRGYFKESSAEIIHFPGVLKDTFEQCLHYFYTDSVDESIGPQNCLPVIELANRLCLSNFIALIEMRIIDIFSAMKIKGVNLSEHVLRLLQSCQVHNAHQLSEWCQYYIITKYEDITLNSPKLLHSLHPDNQAHLNKNRWPPVHYIKEKEYYERCAREQECREKPSKFVLWKTAKKKVNGCLCSLHRNKVPKLNSCSAEEPKHTFPSISEQ